MNDMCYCQYAFVRPECRVQEIGPGVDPQFNVELIREGTIAAVVSRGDLDRFDPERLQGKTAEDIQWLGKIAARHNEIICQAASSSAVLPLRLGTVFRSRDSLLDMLVRCRATVAKFLQRLGNQQEWGVKLYMEGKRGQSPFAANGDSPLFSPPSGEQTPSLKERRGENRASPPSEASGTAYLTRKKADLDNRRELRASVFQTIQSVEQCLAGKAEQCCRIRNLPSDLTGHFEEMVFNAAFLLPPSARESWLETVQNVDRDVRGKGLVLEVSGPWPPYHFCPTLGS